MNKNLTETQFRQLGSLEEGLYIRPLGNWFGEDCIPEDATRTLAELSPDIAEGIMNSAQVLLDVFNDYAANTSTSPFVEATINHRDWVLKFSMESSNRSVFVELSDKIDASRNNASRKKEACNV